MGQPQANPWDRRRLWIVIAAASAVAMALLVTLTGSKESDDPRATVAGFEPVYADLEQRREAAGVSTMGQPADGDAHLHPNLKLFANGERIQIPVNIGIDPTKPGEQMASLHTHETDGTIHIEGMSEATLGQFFEVWGIPFSDDELGPHEAGDDKTIQMWVDGKPSDEFEHLKLVDGQRVVVAYGTEEQLNQVAP